MLQLLLFGCIVFPLIAAVAVALDKEGTLRRRIVYAGTGITALSALGLALYGSFVLPISPDSSLQPLMTVLDLALLVFILYVAVNIRHRLSMGLALGMWYALRQSKKAERGPCALPYLSGIQYVQDGKVGFNGPLNTFVEPKSSNYYLEAWFGEQTLTGRINTIAIVLMVVMLGGLL